jgi:hypothetical protein
MLRFPSVHTTIVSTTCTTTIKNTYLHPSSTVSTSSQRLFCPSLSHWQWVAFISTEDFPAVTDQYYSTALTTIKVEMEMSHWENSITEEVCFSQIHYLTSCISTTRCVHSVSYFAPETNWGNKIWNTSWLQT